MPTRSNGDTGSFMIERRVPNVGEIKRSSGTSNERVFRQILWEIDDRIRMRDWATLIELRDGDVRGVDLIDGKPLRRIPPKPPMMLYFISRADTREIKIGISRKPLLRLKDLQTAHGEPLRILLSVPGDRHFELSLHRRFKACRKSQEWFEETPELLAHIAKLAAEQGAEK